MAGILSLGPGILLFGRIAKAGGNSKLAVAGGTVVVALVFGVVTWAVSRLTLRLERRDEPGPRR